MGQVTLANVHEVLQYHAPDADGLKAIGVIRASAGQFITDILSNCPDCADSSAAIRKVREAMMTANASICLKGEV